MKELFDKHNENVRFLAIYIVEAHAIDEWPVGDPLSITQPISTLERCGIAREFVKEYRPAFPMLVDTIDNNFSNTYSAWPVRFYVIDQGKIRFKAQPDQKNTYDSIPKALDQFLMDNF